jgi:peptidyl-tRNA hydrolase
VTGIDHLYVSVSDLARAEAFYDPVMRLLGFKKGTRPIAGEPHVHYFNAIMQYTLRPARGGEHDPYRPGAVHHLCFRVRDRAAVDALYHGLVELGVAASEPALYEYRPDYYATFFADPDGIRLEIVCDTDGRRVIRTRWRELEDFVDPVATLPAITVERAALPPRPKQVIVMRRDLGMRKGKLIAQGAHASLKVLLDHELAPLAEADTTLTLALDEATNEWLRARFTKVCVYVRSEAELDDVFARAVEADLPCAMIIDAGHTEFGGVPTKTCCAIGPAWTEDVDAITGALPLY